MQNAEIIVAVRHVCMIDLSRIKGVIFDVDGTLLDSMQMWGNVQAEYLKSLGVKPRSDLRDVLRSIGGHETSGYFQVEYGVRKSAEEINSGIYMLMGEFYKKKVALKSGAIVVLDALRERGTKICAATATDRDLIEPGLRRCGLLDYFSRVFTCREECTSKSSPDIFIRAAAFLGTDIGDTLVVEDALYAIRAAKRAGFPVAAVYDLSADNQQDEIRELSDFYFESMDEMLNYLL